MRGAADARYQFDAELARGGMATVWRAWDRRLRVWRAIKVLDKSAAPAERARFEREARALARLHHRHVLPIHDVIDADGDLLLVMDLAWGGSLADRVARLGPLSPRLAVRAAIAIADALTAAHAEGIVHRDVKPANVLLSRDGTPLVADFGIARMGPDATVTRAGAGFGTPAFAAPEQRRDASAVDGRADVYATGATLLFLVTGALPWDVDRQTAADWEDVGVPAPIARVVERATRTEPNARFPTAEALRADLAAVLAELPDEPEPVPLVPDDLPTLPPPADPRAQTARTMAAPTLAFDDPAQQRRRWLAVAGGAVAVLAASLAVVPFAWRPGPPAPPARAWTTEARPPTDGIHARDGVLWFVDGGVVTRAPGGALDGCLAERVIDVGPDRLLLRSQRRAGAEPDAAIRRTFRVTDLGCRDVQAVPDGAYPGVLDPVGGVLDFDRDRVVRLVADAPPVTIVSEVGMRNLAASPSGRWLAWIRSPSESGSSIVVMDRADGSRRELVREEGLVQALGLGALAFVDDDHLMYARGSGWQQTELDLQAVDGGAPTVVAKVPSAPIESIEPIPGGVWLGVLGADYDIHQSVDGGPPTVLVASPGSDRPAAYLADGSLVYASNELGTWDGWRVTPDGVRSVIVGGPAADGRFAVSGDRLVWLRATDAAIEAWVRAPGEDDRLLAELDGAGPSPAHLPPPADVELDCSDAGCVLCRSRDDGLELTALDPVSGATSWRGSVVGAQWCAIADDGAVYTTEVSSDRIGIVRGSDEATFARAGRHVQALRVLPDGRWLASGQRAPAWYVGWLRPDGGDVAEIASAPGWLGHPRASSDGRRVAWLATRQWHAAYELRGP